MRIWTAAIAAVSGLTLLTGVVGLGRADAASLNKDGVVVLAQAAPDADDAPPPVRRRRPPTRLRVYPTYTEPGPGSVRQCVAHYEQEYRQAGTVIVPRMHCWWERG